MKPGKQEAARRLERIIFVNSGSNMIAETEKGLQAKPVTP
jgi:hypothetical protein